MLREHRRAGRADTDFYYSDGLVTITDTVQPQYKLNLNDSDQLTSISEPKPFDVDSTQTLASFTYTSTSGPMSVYTTNALSDNTDYTYRGNDGTLETVDSPDGSSTGYRRSPSPVLSPSGSGGDADHLADLVLTSAAQGIVTTGGDNNTYYSLDPFGNTTSVENALDDTTTSVVDSNGLTLSTVNPDAQVSAANYDGNGNATATFQGQILAPTSDTWTFGNLAPARADLRHLHPILKRQRASLTVTYDESTLTPSGSAAFPPRRWAATGAGRRTVTLARRDPSTPLVITGSSSDNICLLQPMSTMVYDTEDGHDDNQLSCVDPMGNVTATTYDDDNRPVTTSQGQVLPADATFHAAAFENVPHAGIARTIQVYALASTTSGYSFTDTAGSLSLSAVIPQPPRSEAGGTT